MGLGNKPLHTFVFAPGSSLMMCECVFGETGTKLWETINFKKKKMSQRCSRSVTAYLAILIRVNIMFAETFARKRNGSAQLEGSCAPRSFDSPALSAWCQA